MDVYSEVQQVDTEDLINSPFGGRYCGLIPPRDRTSLYRTVAFSFYTDKNSTTQTLFEGHYMFKNDCKLNIFINNTIANSACILDLNIIIYARNKFIAAFQLGTPSPISPCSFVVNSNAKRQGVILTPTYPGIYPKGMKCTYLFQGQASQRVRLEFRDFDLFYGGPQ